MPKIHSLTSCLLLMVLFTSGCASDPNVRKQKFYEQGMRDFNRGRLPEAVISYSRALQIDQHFAEAHYQLAQCFLKQSSWAAAFRELSRTLDLQPDNQPAQLDLGQLFLAAGKYQDAKDRALLILHSNPRHTDAQMLLAGADAALGNLNDALDEATVATKIAPERPAAFITLGLIQAKIGALTDAETNLKTAQSLDPASFTPLLTLGNFYQQQERWADAEKEFHAAINCDPQSVVPRAALAGLYMAKGEKALLEKTLTDTKLQLSDNPEAYRMLGDYFLSHGESAKALSEFAGLSAQHPNDVIVRKTYIQLLVSNQKIDEASQLNEEILKKAPHDADALILKAQIQLQQKRTDESIQSLRQALKYTPENPVGHYQLGVAFQQQGNIQQAESEWRTAVGLRPNLAEAWVALGATAATRQDWSSLEPIGNQLKKFAPQSSAGYLFHATARINQGDSAGAEADLNQLIQISPQSPLGYAKLGQLRASQKRWDMAESLYQKALKLAPAFLDAIQGMVSLDFSRGKPAEALHFIQAQIDRDSHNAALYLLQGESFLRDRQLANAARSFTRCLEIDSQNLAALVRLGEVQKDRGNLTAAAANYQRAISFVPNDAGLYTALGVTYESQGDWQGAQAAYQRALAIRPEEALAANNLAYLLLEHQGNVNVALSLAQVARRGLPNLPNSADTLGWAYFQNRAYTLAAPLLEEAVRGAPSNTTYRYHLGMTYQKLNDPKKARIEFQKSHRLDPNAS